MSTLKCLLASLVLGWSMSAFALNVNTASQAELETINGIGAKMAQRILDERKKAPFKSMPDFEQRVKGIGVKKVAELEKAGLTVGGK